MTPPSKLGGRLERFANARGFVLVAVLWILAALAALDSAYSVYVSKAAVASRLSDDRLDAEAAISSSLELVAYRLLSAPEDARPTKGAFSFLVGRAQVAVRFVSEGARIDLNAAPKDLLAGLFVAVNVDKQQADFYADRIIAWRQKWSDPALDREPLSYKTAGLTYAPREGPFQSILELSLVRSIPPEVTNKVLPFVTIYNGYAEVDPFNAAPQVIAALPGITPDLAKSVLSQRALDPANGLALIEKLGAARARVSTDGRKPARIFVDVALENGHRVGAEAVIILSDGGDDPYRVLYWRDDFDGPS